MGRLYFTCSFVAQYMPIYLDTTLIPNYTTQTNSLKVVGGQKVVNLIDFEPDEFIQGIVLTFLPHFVT